MRHLALYAGKNARQQLQEKGLNAELFKGLAGASGGPKWFTLYGLDRYLYGEFFKNSQQPLFTIGSSAGAFQLACFAQKDPVAAIDRLAHHYSRENYSAKPSIDEISEKARRLLEKVLATDGAREIVENPRVQTHFLVNRGRGLNAFETPFIQALGLLLSATANAMSRKLMHLFFERVVFFAGGGQTQPHYLFKGEKVRFVPMNRSNLHQALLASGSIPLVLSGVKNIQGATPGTYRDGGIIDYHLDIDFGAGGLVLYPHFFPRIKPGWFDKSLSYRHANVKNFDNVLLLTPSAEHVAALPQGRISDRRDFETMDYHSRRKFWQTVLDESHRLADDLDAIVNGQQPLDVQPIESIL